MPLVLDASIALCWALADESHKIAELALERMTTEAAWVPSLWWCEIRNSLLSNERRRRIIEADTTNFLREVARLTTVVDGTPDESAVLVPAHKHRLTVYDAAYLELALRESLMLATLDTDLSRAAEAEAVPLLEAA